MASPEEHRAAEVILKRMAPRCRATKGVYSALTLAISGGIGMTIIGFFVPGAGSPGLIAFVLKAIQSSPGETVSLVTTLITAAHWTSGRVTNLEDRIHEMGLTAEKLSVGDPSWRTHWATVKQLEGKVSRRRKKS